MVFKGLSEEDFIVTETKRWGSGTFAIAFGLALCGWGSKRCPVRLFFCPETARQKPVSLMVAVSLKTCS